MKIIINKIIVLVSQTMILILLSLTSIFSQTDSVINTIVEEMPQFKGGEKELFSFIGNNVRYPPKARDNGIQGKVFVTFIVDTLGNIDSVRLLKDIGGGCGEEAMRVVKLTSGKWTPGIQEGKKINVRFNIPIGFILSEDSPNKKNMATDPFALYYENRSYNLGVEKLKTNEFELAIQYFTEAINNKNNYIDAYYNRGVGYLKVGKKEDACKDWKKAKELGDKEVEELIQKYCQ